MKKTEETIRELNGVRYKIIINAENIKDYAESVARKEWTEDDFKKYGKDLYQARWKTEEVEVKDIIPNWDMLKTEEFKKDLNIRIREQEKNQEKGIAIPPLILRGPDLFIFDGYARWSIFNKKGITVCLAYVAYPISIKYV